MKFNINMLDRIRLKKKPYSILKIVITIILLISVVLIGTPIKYNCLGLNLAIILIGTVLIIHKLFIKKEKILVNKIDIAVLVLYTSTIIPLIFNTYYSLEETLISLVRNISLFNIYLIAKQFINKKEENANFLTNVIIASGIILVILGIDEITAKILYSHVDIINIPIIINIEHRMYSTFGYANTFAIVMAVEVFLCFSKINTKKYWISGLIYAYLLGLWLSYSRSVLAMFLAIFLIFILCNKNNRIYNIYILIENLILVCLYAKIFETFLNKEQYILIWISAFGAVAISIAIAKLISNKYEKVTNIKGKTYIILTVLAFLFVIIIFIIGVHLEKPLTIFKEGQDNRTVRRDIRNVEANKEYCFIFDIEAESKLLKAENYVIEIVEENKYYDTIENHAISFNNYTGKKEIKFTTTNETVKMVIYFKNTKQIAQKGLVIKSLTINDKNKTLDYLYIPVRLVEKLESFIHNDKSVWERLTYYKDSLEIIKDNFLTGTGGRGWFYSYEAVQSYIYGAVEVHSWPLQIFIENGIVSILSFIIVLVYLTIKILKQRKSMTAVAFALILLTLHSIIDFNMSFYCVMLIWVILFAIVSKPDDKENKVTDKFKKIFSMIVIVVNMIALICGICAYMQRNYKQTLQKDINNAIKQKEYNQAILLIDKYEQNEVYDNYYIKLMQLNYKDVEKQNIERIYNKLKQKPIITNTHVNVQRRRLVARIMKETEDRKLSSKFANIIIVENDNMVLNIKDKEKNRLEDEYINNFIQEQKEDYDMALKIVLEEY